MIDFLNNSEEIQDIFQKNFENKDDIDAFFDEEINLICLNNLKKSKLSNIEEFVYCENGTKKLERVMEILNIVNFIFLIA